MSMIICNICGELEDDCKCTEEEKKANPPKPTPQPIVQILNDGSINVKDMTLFYSKKLRGRVHKVVDRIESEVPADTLLTSLPIFHRLVKADPEDYVYLDVTGFRGTEGRKFVHIILDKMLTKEEADVKDRD